MLRPYKLLFPLAAPITSGTRLKVHAHIRSWRSLFRFLRIASVEDIQTALEVEQQNRARPQMMRRIITRLATLERNRLYKLLNIKTK